MKTAILDGGFADVPVEAALAFRGVMSAMARPGRVETVAGARPPSPLSAAAGAVLLTLAVHATPLHLAGACDTDAVRDWLRFHCSAPLVAPGHAMFAVGAWGELCPLTQYAIGTPEYRPARRREHVRST